jgi:CHAT domain-containing protein
VPRGATPRPSRTYKRTLSICEKAFGPEHAWVGTALLKLDADWVILSACNTAAGGAKGAEALSGLARAFIYPGAERCW